LEVKYLSFAFDRVWQDDVITQALITVTDVTPRIALTRELKEAAARMERQAELLFGVMHVDPAMLREFIDSARARLEESSDSLRQAIDPKVTTTLRQERYREQLAGISRNVHRVKGEAALLRIGFFQEAAHRFEDKLKNLQQKPKLDGNDFLPVVVDLSQLISNLDDVKEVLARVSALHQAMSKVPDSAGPQDPGAAFIQGMDVLVNEMTGRAGKMAQIRFGRIDVTKLSPTRRRGLRDIAIQLLRNAVVHGIERPEERRALGKEPTGDIELHIYEEAGKIQFVVRDDGTGLDYGKIAERALIMAESEPQLLEELVDRDSQQWRLDALAALIFKPGFSTVADSATIDAGRGFGLDLVVAEVHSLAGTIGVYSEPGQYCQFVIDLPLYKS
jgi:chemotaxis protein histidine kinase CheA